MRKMRGNGKIASISLGVFIASGILGLACLMTWGFKTSGQAGPAETEVSFLLPALCVILGAMVISMVVMLLALPRRR